LGTDIVEHSEDVDAVTVTRSRAFKRASEQAVFDLAYLWEIPEAFGRLVPRPLAAT
jgi:hypothetical protein